VPPTGETGATHFAVQRSPSRACHLWVKTRIPFLGCYVCFRQLRTVGPREWSRLMPTGARVRQRAPHRVPLRPEAASSHGQGVEPSDPASVLDVEQRVVSGEIAGDQMLNASNSTAAIPNSSTASDTGSYSSQTCMILSTLPIARRAQSAPTMATQLLDTK
jgi:hypothetical protein